MLMPLNWGHSLEDHSSDIDDTGGVMQGPHVLDLFSPWLHSRTTWGVLKTPNTVLGFCQSYLHSKWLWFWFVCRKGIFKHFPADSNVQTKLSTIVRDYNDFSGFSRMDPNTTRVCIKGGSFPFKFIFSTNNWHDIYQWDYEWLRITVTRGEHVRIMLFW